MSSLVITDLGDRYRASWIGDQVDRIGDSSIELCLEHGPHGTTGDAPVPPVFDVAIEQLGNQSLYPETVTSIGISVGVGPVGSWWTWRCAPCGSCEFFGNNEYLIELSPQIFDYLGAPVETASAPLGYSAFLGWHTPGAWPSLAWQVSLDEVHHIRFGPIATAIAWKVPLPPDAVPPDVPPGEGFQPDPPPIPPCNEAIPGQVQGAPGPFGVVRLG